ncbi:MULTISPECIES: cysteine hydrolase family protein [unclassified Microbacterium]|uniref:cysteine hydrolase family protein n=1 Tax=unclassified Microbacterium TaxID=2609290 RepID=UPI00301A6872
MTTALLLMDFQNGIAGRYAEGGSDVLVHAQRALAAARAAGIPVVFVRVAFREGFPEAAARNKAFGAIRQSPTAPYMGEDAEATQIVAALAPLPGEPVVIKRRYGAFASDLDVLLRGLDATDLVLAGVSTSGVVLSTVRHAADHDFGLTVLSDACADQDPEVHRVLLEKVFPRQADVVTVDEWASGLSGGDAGRG